MDEKTDMTIDAINAVAVESLATVLSLGDEKLKKYLRSMFLVLAKYDVPASKWAMLLYDIGKCCEINNREFDEYGDSLGCQD